MTIKVCGHRFMVSVDKLEEVDNVYKKATASGIIIADTEESRRREAGLDRGTIVAIGEDCWKAFHLSANTTLDGFKPWAKVGDFVAYAKYSGKMIEDQETQKKYVICNDEDLVAVLKESA